MANKLDPVVTEITNVKGVLESATAYVNSVPQLLQDALDEALANGATAEQIAPVQALADAMQASSDALVAAMAANAKPTPTGVPRTGVPPA